MTRLVLACINSPLAYELRPGLNKVGRNPTNDFKLSDPSVSSFHAEFVVSGDKILVRDAGSTNGTFLDDLRIEEGELTANSRLRLGNVEMRLEEAAVADTAFINKSDRIRSAEQRPLCAHHPDVPATYWCEHCGGNFCDLCVKVVGADRQGEKTFCPLCNGQCNHLPQAKAVRAEKTLLARLTQTLKLPRMK